MEEQRLEDKRFAINNTKLAAAIVTFGFLLKKTQPFMTVIEADDPAKKQVTIFVEPSSAYDIAHLYYHEPDGRRAKFLAWHFEVAWKKRELWEKQNPVHPFNNIRHGIEAREWIIQNFIRNSPPTGTLPFPPPAKQFLTPELKLASILKGMNHYLYGIENREFVFEKCADIEEQAAIYNGEPNGTPCQWMKLGLMNYELLNKRIKQPDNTPVIRFERVVRGKKKILLLPTNCPDAEREQFMELFYSNAA